MSGLLASLVAFWWWLWLGQAGPVVDFLAVLAGAALAFLQGQAQWRKQQATERAQRKEEERQAFIHLLMAVADEGENARHLLNQAAEHAEVGRPEMAEIPTTTLEAAISNPLVFQAPLSLQVAMRAYLSAARTARNMLEARRLTFAATGNDWSEAHVEDFRRAMLRVSRLLTVMRRELQKLAPRYGVRREIDPDYETVIRDIVTINEDQALAPSAEPGPTTPEGPTQTSS